MKTYSQLVNEAVSAIREIFPWDLAEALAEREIMIVDVREPYEYDVLRIKGSINVPRGILEMACDYDFQETVPELVEAREREIVLVCRSGNRTIFAAYVMQVLGYINVASLKTGLRGWNDYDQPLVDSAGRPLDADTAEDYFTPKLRPEQMRPGGHA